MADITTLALAAVVPIAVVFVLLVVFRWSAVRSMGVGWVLASALGLSMWGMELRWWAAAAVKGVLEALSIVLIVFGAVLLMNYLEGSGAIATIRWYFTQLAEDRRVQLLLIGLGFETVIEGAAGFGTPGALAAPLFIGLGFPPLAAAVFGLFFDAPSPPFGAAGTPVLGGVGAVIAEPLPADVPEGQFLEMVSAWTGLFTGLSYVFWGLLGVFLLAFWFGDGDGRSVRAALGATAPVAPLALLLGLVVGSVQLVVAWFLGPALPDIAAGFAALGVGVALANRGALTPDEPWTFPDADGWSDAWRGGLALDEFTTDDPRKRMAVSLAWAPYLLVALALLATRWPGLGVGEWLQRFTLSVPAILGTDLSYSIAPLYLPGTMPFLPVAVLTGFLHRMDATEVASAWRDSFEQVAPAAATLIVAVSMTQVMIQSATNAFGQIGMMTSLSRAVALGAGGLLPVISPWIGALGAFMTGSNTSSNILFSVLQYEAAADVGLSRTVVVALQNVGGGIGNMVSVLNIAAICGVAGITGYEGDILRKTAAVTAAFALAAGLLGLLLAYAVVPGLF